MKEKQLNIYRPIGTDNYELCHPVSNDDFERINVEVSGKIRPDWAPIQMQLIQKDERRNLLESDSPWLGGHALIFRKRAIDAIGPILLEHGELLPLSCDAAQLTMYNATRVLNALDDGASSVQRFPDGRIMMIRRYVFRPDVIQGADIFKIPNLRVSPTFVSRRFVEMWNSAGLKGLEFKQVWAPN